MFYQTYIKKIIKMEQPTKRLQSIDALRGFDMFWIMGGPWIIASLHGIFGGHAWSG